MSENSLAVIKNKSTNSLVVKSYMQAIDMMLKNRNSKCQNTQKLILLRLVLLKNIFSI